MGGFHLLHVGGPLTSQHLVGRGLWEGREIQFKLLCTLGHVKFSKLCWSVLFLTPPPPPPKSMWKYCKSTRMLLCLFSAVFYIFKVSKCWTYSLNVFHDELERETFFCWFVLFLFFVILHPCFSFIFSLLVRVKAAVFHYF